MAAPKKNETATEGKPKEKPPFEKPSHCLICGQEGPSLLYGHWICDRCRNVVQAEALSERRKIIKEGSGP